MKSNNSWTRIAVVAVAVAHGGAASAQSDELTGIRAGAFTITPEIAAEAGYSDNYLRSPNAEESLFGTIAPSIAVRSNWSRHSFELNLRNSNTFYSEDADESIFEVGTDAALGIDVTRATRVTFGADYGLFGENSGNDNIQGLVDGTTYNQVYGGGVRADVKPGRVRVSPFAGVHWADFFDSDQVGGGTIDNGDRDRTTIDYGVEVGFEYIRGYEIFVAGAGQHIDYDNSVDDNGFRQGSDNFRGLVGVNFRVTSLIEGRAGVGYAFRTNEDSRFGDSGAFSTDVGLTWIPTPIITVNLDASQTFNETTVAGASTSNDYAVKLGLKYDWRRNISFLPSVGYSRSEFEDINRTDDQFEVGLGAQYSLNEHFSLGAEYKYTTEDSTVGEWDENSFSIGFVGRY